MAAEVEPVHSGIGVMGMKFSDIGILTARVPELVVFYETVFGAKAEGDHIHSHLQLDGLGIAIYDRGAATRDMGFELEGAGTGLLTIGFNVEDADVEYERILSLGIAEPTKPQLWPWGAKSFRFSDPDGNILLFRSRPKL